MILYTDPLKIEFPISYVNIGSHTEFKCLSTSKPRWFFNGGNLPKNSRVNNNILRVQEVNFQNQGTYECMWTTDDRKHFFSKAELNILGKFF